MPLKFSYSQNVSLIFDAAHRYFTAVSGQKFALSDNSPPVRALPGIKGRAGVGIGLTGRYLTYISSHRQEYQTDGLLVLQHHQASNATGTEQQFS